MERTAHHARRKIPIPIHMNTRPAPKITSKQQHAAAKMGMAASLSALFVSGFFKFHGARSLHLCSGFGLLALTVWHHFLNQPKTKPKRR